MTQAQIAFRLNGTDRSGSVPTDRFLLDYLREDLGLTGTKEGCGIGVCGICTVLVDDKPVSACLLLAAVIDGSELRTIEGIANEDGSLSQVQRAFLEHGGFQCGICTPGQVVAATALLETDPHPTEAQVRGWMMGNLCRCTGYYQIVESILRAAETAGTDVAEGRERPGHELAR